MGAPDFVKPGGFHVVQWGERGGYAYCRDEMPPGNTLTYLWSKYHFKPPFCLCARGTRTDRKSYNWDDAVAGLNLQLTLEVLDGSR